MDLNNLRGRCPNDELWRLVSALCDGTLTEPERDHLESQLRGNPNSKLFAAAYLDLHAQFIWRHRETVAGDQWPVAMEEAAGSEQQTTVGNQKLAASASLRSPVLGFLDRVNTPFSKPILWSTIGVGILYCGYLVAISWNLRSSLSAAKNNARDSMVAMVSDADEVRWSNDTSPRSNDAPIREGELLKIESGVVELRLKSGTTLVVEGPAQWSIDGDNHATLHTGRIVAKVPRKAIGFALETSTTTIVDLGTEFGVQASEVAADVQVFAGRVLVKSTQASANESKPIILSAGQSRRIEAGAVSGEIVSSEIIVPQKLFRRELRKEPAKRQTAYPESLVAYWNFDEDHGPVWDQRGKFHGVIEDAERVPGLIGAGAIRFDNRAGQRVRIPTIAGDLLAPDAFTVEAVFTSNWSGQPLDYDEIFRQDPLVTLSFQNDGNDGIDGPVLAFETPHGLIDLPLDGVHGRLALADLTDGKTHYVAATFDGSAGELSLYVDGVARQTQQIEKGAIPTSTANQAHFGNYVGNLEEPFSGILDEIAVYRNALAPAEISRHWGQVKRGHDFFGTAK